MTYWVTSTTGLMERTPARRRRSRIQTGVVARLLTPRMTQPTNVGQAAGASRCTATESRDDVLAAVAASEVTPAAALDFGVAGTTPSPSAQASMVSGAGASNTSPSLG